MGCLKLPEIHLISRGVGVYISSPCFMEFFVFVFFFFIEKVTFLLINSYPFDRLVSGAGDIKLTKDGNVLLHEMVRVAVLGFKKKKS